MVDVVKRGDLPMRVTIEAHSDHPLGPAESIRRGRDRRHGDGCDHPSPRSSGHNDRICVLSPISARLTSAVETRNASTEYDWGREELNLGTAPPPDPGAGNRCQRSGQASRAVCTMAEAKHVDTGPAPGAGGYSPMTARF